MKTKQAARKKRQARVRGKIIGTAERPRLCVSRSLTAIYVQLIDDSTGRTLVSASTKDADFKGAYGGNISAAAAVGELIAKRALEAKIKSVVFDRNGFVYQGRVEAVAEGARKGGLEF